MPDTIESTTTISEVDINLDEILGTPGADTIMLPKEEEEKKPTLFSNNPVDMSFLDAKPVEGEKLTIEESTKELNEIVNEEVTLADSQTKGRPKIEKNGVIELTNKLIEKGLIMPFDEDKTLEDYSIQDFQELIEANINERERKVREQTPAEFFESLPVELQYAAKYVADGGTNLKDLFRTLAVSEEVKSLDPSIEEDQENIVRTYLHATGFGESSDIEEEIDGWKDRGELETKANKFKPKLDAMQESVVAKKLQQQEVNRKKKEHQANQYMNSIYETLEPGDLNGIKLDKKTQSMLYAGLTQPAYPSLSGKSTNYLGHLLEKYQFIEPNPALIAEALWLLADPEGYKDKLKDSAKKETTEKHVRMLKTEQASKISSTSPESEETGRSKKNTVSRPSAGGFFKR